MEKEIWKEIEGHEKYSVSNLGNVKNNKTERILKPGIINSGYCSVFIDKKNLLVHRLVGLAFVEGYFEGAEIDHINRVRIDNRVENLRWVTRKENIDNVCLDGRRADLSNIMKLKHKDENYKKKLLEANHKKRERTFAMLDEMFDENLSVMQNLRNINNSGHSVCRATIYKWLNSK